MKTYQLMKQWSSIQQSPSEYTSILHLQSSLWYHMTQRNCTWKSCLNTPSILHLWSHLWVVHEEKKQQSSAIPLWMHLNINFLQHFLSIPNQDSRNTLSLYICQASKRLVLEAYSEVKNDLGRHTCLWDCREKLDNNTLKVCNCCVSCWNVRISWATAQFFRCKSMIISSSISMRMSVRERRRSSSPWPLE